MPVQRGCPALKRAAVPFLLFLFGFILGFLCLIPRLSQDPDTTPATPLSSADAAAEGGDLEAAARDYLAPFQPFCTAGGLETLASNRYPTRCDSLAQEYGVALQPGEAEISEPDGSGASAFSLPVDLVSDGQTAGSVTLEGQLVFAEEDGALLVDGLALYNLDDLSAALGGG